MFRFDQMIHSHMTVREVMQRWPGTSEVFDRFGFRSVCHDCDVQTVASRQGLPPADVVLALNLAVFGDPAAECDPAGEREPAVCRRA